jgi:AraC-like DNA-binding protein
VGVNQTKLKAGFRRLIGKTIHQYVMHCRMERASDLLLTGDYPVAEGLVGYEYTANFTAAFKRTFGRVPKRWVKTQAAANWCKRPLPASSNSGVFRFNYPKFLAHLWF